MDDIARLRRLVVGLTIAVCVLGALQLLSLFHKPQRVHMASLKVDSITIGRDNEIQTVITPGEITLGNQTNSARLSGLEGPGLTLTAGGSRVEFQTGAGGMKLSMSVAKPANRSFELRLDKDRSELRLARTNATVVFDLNDTRSAFNFTGQTAGQQAVATLNVGSDTEKTGLRLGDPTGIATLIPGSNVQPVVNPQPEVVLPPGTITPPAVRPN